MKHIMALYNWLDTAVSGIRFGPDREAVRRELAGHIEDRTADLMRVFPDIPEKEAQERALAAMGDPWEVKEELARVHTPWLGWLWTASRVLVWAALALALVLMLDSGLGSLPSRWREFRETRTVGRALYEDGAPDWEGERLAVLQVEGEARLDRAVVSVSRAARWREPEGDRLYLRLRITWDRPWETNQWAMNRLWAEDDLGNTYQITSARALLDGWNWCQRDLALEGVPSEARELRIHHELRDGLDLALDLSEEVGP